MRRAARRRRARPRPPAERGGASSAAAGGGPPDAGARCRAAHAGAARAGSAGRSAVVYRRVRRDARRGARRGARPRAAAAEARARRRASALGDTAASAEVPSRLPTRDQLVRRPRRRPRRRGCAPARPPADHAHRARRDGQDAAGRRGRQAGRTGRRVRRPRRARTARVLRRDGGRGVRDPVRRRRSVAASSRRARRRARRGRPGQLRAPARSLRQLARTCWRRGAGMRVLATSRERARGARRTGASRRAAAAPAPTHAPREIRASPAVRLFADRAAATRPGFVVTAENAAVVAEICRRLDGLPLAVELAAAQTSALPLRTLADRLDDGLLGEPRRRAAPPEPAATVAWSHDLLPEPERALFRAARCVPRRLRPGRRRGIAPAATRRLPLAHLVECSLVQAEDGRFRLLSTTRAFAGPRRRRRSSRPPPPPRPPLPRPRPPRAPAPAPRGFRPLARRAAPRARQPARRAELGGGPGRRAARCWSGWREPLALLGRARLARRRLRWLTAALASWVRRARAHGLLSAAALLHLGAPSSPPRRRWPASSTGSPSRRELAAWAGDALALPRPSPGRAGQFDRAQQLYEDGIAASLAAGDLWRASMAEAQLARLHRDRCEPDAARALAERAPPTPTPWARSWPAGWPATSPRRSSTAGATGPRRNGSPKRR